MRTFEFKDGKSNKFWNIHLQGKSFTVTFGKIGTAGQTQKKKFPSEAAARAAHDKLVEEKLGKGYVEKPGLMDALRQTLGSLGPNARPEDMLRHLKAEFGISPPAPAAARRTFEFKDGTSNKFWTIDLQGKSFMVTFGKIGSAGQSQEKKFRSEPAARAACDKLVAEKLRKGYVETGAAQPVAEKSGKGGAAAAVSPGASAGKALENAILADPDDLGAHAAYADWLIEQGDPRGEFIQVQLALEDERRSSAERRKLKKREEELLKAHCMEWVGEWATQAEVGRPEGYGQLDFPTTQVHTFIRGVLAEVTIGELSDKCAEAFVRSAQTRMVRRLFIGGWGYEGEYEAYDVLARWAYFANLRTFQLGWTSDEQYDDYCSFQCHLNGDPALNLVKKMPNIEELYLFAHDVAGDVFGIRMPNLRVLQVYHSSDYRLVELAQNPSLTKLTHLLCHPRSIDYGGKAYIGLPELTAIVRSRHLKSLTHLRLRLADFGDEGCKEIVKSRVLQRLEVLDLRHGRITDAGARLLVSCPDLKRLKMLDVSRNDLSDEGTKTLESVGIPVSTERQWRSTPDVGDPGDPGNYLHQGDIE
jgi:uncharacterized protein (TIGR02996 family)